MEGFEVLALCAGVAVVCFFWGYYAGYPKPLKENQWMDGFGKRWYVVSQGDLGVTITTNTDRESRVLTWEQARQAFPHLKENNVLRIERNVLYENAEAG